MLDPPAPGEQNINIKSILEIGRKPIMAAITEKLEFVNILVNI